MNIRKLSLAILTISAIAPVVAFASGEEAALNACAKAFAGSVGGASTYKLNYDQKHATSSLASFYVRTYSFTLQAQDKKTGAPLASATCSADTHGEVLALTPAATASKLTLAAR